MKTFFTKIQNTFKKPLSQNALGFFMVFASFFLIELLVAWLLQPVDPTLLAFGCLWSLLFTGLVLFLPRLAGRILFGSLYFPCLLWGLAQVGYHQVFGNLMWLSTVTLAGEGSDYLGDVLAGFPALWWIGLVLLLGIGVTVIVFFPRTPAKILRRLPFFACCISAIAGLCLLPELVFLRDKNIWGAENDYNPSS